MNLVIFQKSQPLISVHVMIVTAFIPSTESLPCIGDDNEIHKGKFIHESNTS